MFNNLDAIINVGYRVDSVYVTQFRQWCTYVLGKVSFRVSKDSPGTRNEKLPIKLVCLAKPSLFPLCSNFTLLGVYMSTGIN